MSELTPEVDFHVRHYPKDEHGRVLIEFADGLPNPDTEASYAFEMSDPASVAALIGVFQSALDALVPGGT